MAEDLIGTISGRILLNISDAMSNLTKLRQDYLSTFSAMGQAAGTLDAVGEGFMNFGKKAIGALWEAGSAWGEFERKMDYVAVVAGATGKELDGLTSLVKQLGADTIYTNAEVADGFTELAKAGVDAKDILGGVGEGITFLGAAADIGLGQAATIMMSVVQTWGMAADEAVSVADRLSGSANASMVDIDDLGTSLKYAGSVAAALGIDFDEVNAALGLLGERSIKGSQAGTSLRMMMLSLIGRTGPAIKQMEELGIITEDGANQFFNASGEAKGLSEVMDILNSSMSHLTAGEKTKALKTIFDTRAMPAALTLMEQGSEGFERMSEAIEGTLASEVASARLDNLSGDIEYLKGEVDNLLISVGEFIANGLRPVVQWLEQTIAWVNQLSPGLKNLLTVITLIAGSSALLVGGFFKAAAGALTMAANVGILALTLDGMAAAGTRARIVLNTLFKVGAIGVIITVIGAIVAALVYFFMKTEEGQAIWDKFMGAISAFMSGPGAGLIDMIVQLATTVGTFLANGLSTIIGLFTGVGDGMAGVAGGVGSLLSSGLSVVISLFSTLGQFLMDLILPAIQLLAPIFTQFAAAIAGVSTDMQGMNGAADIFAQVLVAIIEMATQLILVFIDLGVQILVAVLGMLPVIIEAFVGLLVTIIEVVVGMIPTLIEAFITGLTGIINAIITILPMVIDGIIILVTGILTALVSALPMIIQAGITLLTGLITAITTLLPIIIDAVVAIIPPLIMALVGAIPMILTAAIELFMALIDALMIIVPQVITALMDAIPLILGALIDAVPLILEAAIEAFMSLVTALVTIIPELITAIIDLLPIIIETLIGLIPVLVDAAIQLFMAIVMAIPQIISALIPAIISLIPVIINTVISLIPQLITAAVQLFMAIVKAIPQIVTALVDALMTLGKQMIDGLVNGLKEMGPKVLDAIGSIVNGAIDWAKGLLGIKSPSRVFRDIGANVGEGMAIGITGTEKQVTSAIDKMLKSTEKGFQTLVDQRTTAQKKLDDLRFKQSTDKTYNANRARDIQQTIDEINSLNHALSKQSAVMSNLKNANSQLLKIAQDRDLVTSKLKAAQKNLKKLQDEQEGFFSDFVDGANDRANVSGKKTVDGMLYGVEREIEKAAEFNKLIEELQTKGLDQQSLNELIQEFASNGSLTAARALADADEAALAQLAELRKKLQDEAEKAGSAAGGIMYDAGIEITEGLIKGLEKDLDAINAVAKKIADTITNTVKKELGIKSPSREMIEVGGYIMEGLIGSILDEKTQLVKALTEMASQITQFADDALSAKQFEVETLMTIRATDEAALSIAASRNDSMIIERLDKLTALLVKNNDVGGDTFEIGDILIPLEDLAQLKTLEDFLDMLRVYKRQRGR